MMLQEIAITPSVFRTESYSSREECDSKLEGLSEVLLAHFLVRDLRDGDWFKELWREKNLCPNWGQKLLKQLKTNLRIRSFPPALDDAPGSSEDWCREALATQQSEALAGILSCKATKGAFPNEVLVASIDRCRSANWWKTAAEGGPPRIGRNTAAFLDAFGLVFRHAAHVIFMDPHLDPERSDYREFVQLLVQCRGASLIEIHRVCYEGMGSRNIVENSEWERRFNEKLWPVARQHSLRIRVFIWPDEHDRHLVTNLMSFHLGHGFSISGASTAKMTCSRLTRTQSDVIQREVDPGVNTPHHYFVIGE